MKKKKICILINVDWFAISHFLHYFKKIISEGHELSLITSNTGQIDKLKLSGIEVHEVKLDRGFKSIFSEINSIIEIYKTIKKINPEYFEMITIKSIIYGGFISRLLNIKKNIIYVSGLGSQFKEERFFKSLKSNFIMLVYRFLILKKNTTVIVENNQDFQTFNNLVKNFKTNVLKINGVGVEIKKISYKKKNYESKSILNILMAGRLLKDKGLLEFLNTAQKCSEEKLNLNFFVAGDIDESNPESITQSDLLRFKKLKYVKFLGHIDNLNKLFFDVDIFVLPSYREGFPKVIMEASSFGIPVITTNVPGCQDAIENHKTGILVEPRSFKEIYKKIKFFNQNRKILQDMSTEGRAYALKNFDVEKISRKHISVWSL